MEWSFTTEEVFECDFCGNVRSGEQFREVIFDGENENGTEIRRTVCDECFKKLGETFYFEENE